MTDHTIINGISYADSIADDSRANKAQMDSWAGAIDALESVLGTPEDYDVEALAEEIIVWSAELGRYILPDQTPLVDICMKHRIES